MLDPAGYLFLLLSCLFGSATGYLLESFAREKKTGKPQPFRFLLFTTYLMCGVICGSAIFFYLTLETEPAPIHYVVAAVVGCWGFAILVQSGGWVMSRFKRVFAALLGGDPKE